MTDEIPSYVPKFKLVADFSDDASRLEASRMCPDGAGRVHGEYRIHKGLYYQKLRDHQRALKIHGLLFVATHNGRVVAFARRHSTWVEPEHRGRGLAPEMIADMIEAYGGPERFYAQDFATRRTAGGAKMTIATRKILVARGVVKE